MRKANFAVGGRKAFEGSFAIVASFLDKDGLLLGVSLAPRVFFLLEGSFLPKDSLLVKGSFLFDGSFLLKDSLLGGSLFLSGDSLLFIDSLLLWDSLFARDSRLFLYSFLAKGSFLSRDSLMLKEPRFSVDSFLPGDFFRFKDSFISTDFFRPGDFLLPDGNNKPKNSKFSENSLWFVEKGVWTGSSFLERLNLGFFCVDSLGGRGPSRVPSMLISFRVWGVVVFFSSFLKSLRSLAIFSTKFSIRPSLPELGRRFWFD